jgi:hypothetical protein
MQPLSGPPAIRSASHCPHPRDDDRRETPGDAGEADPFDELADLLDRSREEDGEPFDGIVTI